MEVVGALVAGGRSQSEQESHPPQQAVSPPPWIVGWDPTHGEYRATLADSYGHADVMRGRVDGDRLIFERCTLRRRTSA